MTIRFTPRSTNGCFTCKRRKKKCDEQKPHCLRCTKGGFECEGYPAFERRIRRITFDPPTNPSSKQSTSRVESSGTLVRSTLIISPKQESDVATPPNKLESSPDPVKTSSPDTSWINWKPSAADSPKSNKNLDESQSLTPDPSYGPSGTVGSYPTGSTLLLSPGSSLNMLPAQSSIASNSMGNVILTPGQASLLGSLFSLAHPEDQLPKLIEPGQTNLSSNLLHGPDWSPWSSIHDAALVSSDEDDSEGVRDIICRSPTPDPNTQSNALPFVLQSYARWVNFVVFEPLKVAGMIREGVIMQFASSPEVRTRTCLIANVIGKLSKAPELDKNGMSIVSMLRSEAHQNIMHFHSTKPASERETDMQNALGVLDNMMEMILIQRYSGPLVSVIALMAAAAPVFRRACPDPPERLVNLPNILASPGLNLQHFAATDVIISVTTARPMFFKYDVTCSPEAFGQLVKGEYGLQWLHGVPDRFIVLLAWINALREDYGNSVDSRYVLEIENQVQSIKIEPGFSPDPILLILRLAVQECWRQTVYVYLYMALCGTRADDPRVTRAVRAFVKIVNGVKPGRNPDSFLFIPIMVVGAFAYRERDRDVLRRRMTGLRECTNPGAAGYDCLEILEDIWRRTQAENRPASWLDLRISCQDVAGI
ncbi:unnamed protein product [Rhizoctonia solani]|uniref:Zn(2)-C6 fungal-type domain-containing protein n=1 Tax=Rhizoctonia solani TaxID=456999 RepID=A0A8H3EBR8_9AGAM|nr:unnamed protein product [Rhizoctonia solani]